MVFVVCMPQEMFELFFELRVKMSEENIAFGDIVSRCKNCLTTVNGSNNKKETPAETKLDTDHEGINKKLLQFANEETSETFDEPRRKGPSNFVSKQVCQFYKRGSCRHGSSGKRRVDGVFCKYSHPKKCKQFCSFGSNDILGCTSPCGLMHPFLCNASVKYGECRNPRCTNQHLKGTVRLWNQTGQHTLTGNLHSMNNHGFKMDSYNKNSHFQNPKYNNSNFFPNNYKEKEGLYHQRTTFSEENVGESLKKIINSINDLQKQNVNLTTQLHSLESNYFQSNQVKNRIFENAVDSPSHRNEKYDDCWVQNQGPRPFAGVQYGSQAKNFQQNLQPYQ